MARKRRSPFVIPAIGSVVVAKGTDREVEYEIPAPLGQVGTELAFNLMKTLTEFQSVRANIGEATEGDASGQMASTIAVMDALERIVGSANWWTTLMPKAFGVYGDKDEIDALATSYTAMELFDPFVEAARVITDYAFGSTETQAALKKSNGEEVEAEKE